MSRLAPSDMDAEAAVLSAVLLSRDALDQASEAIGPEMFWSDANGRVYEAALDLHRAGVTVDLVTVASELRRRDQLQSIGGPSYLAQLADATPAVGHVLAHAKVVRDRWKLRRLIETCQRVAAESYDQADARAWLDEVESQFREVCSDDTGDATAENARDVMVQVWRDVQAEKQPGLRTGLDDLDSILGGLLPGQLICVGAHSGIGKSALATNVATHVAFSDSRRSVLVFSLEMSKGEIIQRALFAEAKVNSRKVGNYQWITDAEWQRLAGSAQRVGLTNLWLDDKPGLTIGQIRSRARRMHGQCNREGKPLALVVVDYAQLVASPSTNKARNREQEVAEVSRSLKQMAKELGVPVMVLAQLNEDSRKDKRKPRASDLRESRAMHHDSDKVILIHNEHAEARAQAYRSGQQPPDSPGGEECDLIVDKNRGGTTGTARVLFVPEYTLFATIAPMCALDDQVLPTEGSAMNVHGVAAR